MPNLRLLTPCAIAALAALAVGCSKKEPPPAPATPASTQARSRSPAPAPYREHREYTDMPTGPIPGQNTTTTAHAIEAEALRGGPRGEPRVFENATEQAELARGSAPKYMNGQFRYYLAGVSFVQQDGPCRTPQLVVRLAVENLHGNPTAAIRGRITFARSGAAEGSSQIAETVAVPYGVDIVGPFSDQRGGIRYVTAHVDHVDAFLDPKRWAEIGDVSAARLKVWFAPEVIYYPDGTQYSPSTGLAPAAREPVTCGGGEGSVRAIAH